MPCARRRQDRRDRAARSPWAIAAVGALFALSFDTLSQTALFSLAAVQFGGLMHAQVLGALFVAGMLLTLTALARVMPSPQALPAVSTSLGSQRPWGLDAMRRVLRLTTMPSRTR